MSSKKKRIILYLLLAVIAMFASPLVGELLDKTLQGVFQTHTFIYDFNYAGCLVRFLLSRNRRILTALAYLLIVGLEALNGKMAKPNPGKNDTVEISKGIWIPVPAGNGEYGTSRFMTEKEMDSCFSTAVYDGRKMTGLSENAGMVVDYKKIGKKEYIRYLSEPVNVEILGATRSGKTRRLLMTSIWLNLLAGINMFVIDVKGEICAYTSPFARDHGYEVRILDLRDPDRSQRFNYLGEIIVLLKKGRISDAVDKAWDIVSILVGEPKGERIWTDGQCATIAAAMLIVAQDAPEGCKNLTNVYYFLAYMCEPDPETGEMPINDYLDQLPYNHPARGAFQIAKIAPYRTRSSFFTSALATLRLFTSWSIADVTKSSEYSLNDIDEKKVITYLIVPDEKTTYHPLGAIYIKQIYEALVEQAKRKGGKLDRRFIFKSDEIGNFPVIPGLGTMLSAGAGRNIFFELIWQDYQQEESRYKDDFRNIRTNSQLTMCLKATDEQTTKSLSNRMNNYTIRVHAASNSQSDGKTNSISYSSSSNLAGRPLMFPNEISAIEKPDALLLYGGKQAIVNLPDISAYYANKEFGMGDEEFNRKLYLQRLEERPARESLEPKLWGIWDKFKVQPAQKEPDKKVSFLDD